MKDFSFGDLVFCTVININLLICNEKQIQKEARKWHPDRNQDNVEYATERMKRIGQAYEVLKDPTKRAAYNNNKKGPDTFVYDDKVNRVIITLFRNASTHLVSREWKSEDFNTMLLFGVVGGLFSLFTSPNDSTTLIRTIIGMVGGAMAPFAFEALIKSVDQLSAPQQRLVVDALQMWLTQH
jgi:DnaJ-domain-containing protein 1